VAEWMIVAALVLGADDHVGRKIDELTKAIADDPKNVKLHSQRGDLYFQSRKFAEASSDYQKMVELNPSLDVTHWRKGIALYYLGRWEESAKQFEKYQTIDDVDRENGIWRFLAMQKKVGMQKARDEMIQYTRVDRPPLTDVYRMFQGELSTEEFSNRALKFAEHSMERFYADLYLGLFFDCEGKPAKSLEHLRAAEKNRSAKEATDGPGWMWHIAGIHAGIVERELKKKSEVKTPTKKAG
jgi:lipoprotein NlpI